jgi:TonB family protein
VNRARARNVLGWTWAVSIALHVGAVAGFGWLALRSIEHRAASAPPHAGDGTIAVELPGVAEGTLLADHLVEPKGDPPKVFGGSSEARLDQKRQGRGGAPTAEEHATNLSDHDERMHRTQDLQSELELDQQQRLRTGHERQSWEDRRSSKDPMELTFLASGTGARPERRTPSPVDPSRGGARSDAPSVRGGSVGESERVDGADEAGATLGAERDGMRTSAPGLGVHDGHAGTDHRTGAHVMRARPDVVLAAVSIPAMRHGRPRDDIDSDQEVSKTIRSIVHASTAAGAPGSDTGGTSGGGDPGAGGAMGPGTSARPLGPGDAEWWDLDTSDSRLMPYFRRVHAKLDPLWRHAFPLEAALELRQGTVILAVTIAADGSVAVAWPPQRPSGIPQFDRNCYDAVLRAAPFDPIPAALGVSELHVKMPFDARNPIVK